MRLAKAVKVCLKKYADFEGRASRSEYWWFVLANTLGLAAIILASGLWVGFSDPQRPPDGAWVLLILGGLAWWLAFAIPTLAACSRRLHDTNRSGWMQLLHFVPFGGWVLLIVCCFDGDKGANPYGDRPLE